MGQDTEVKPRGHGGKRPGSGRPKGRPTEILNTTINPTHKKRLTWESASRGISMGALLDEILDAHYKDKDSIGLDTATTPLTTDSNSHAQA